MKSRILIILFGFQLLIVCSGNYASPPIGELGKNIEYVKSFLENSNHEDPENHLTSLLRGMSGIEVSIYFRTDSAEIDKRGREQIYTLAKAMWVYPMVNFSLSGRTDSRGSKEYNIGLAEKRVAAVQEVFKDALAREGYDPKRFYPLARGESFALAEVHDEEGMSLDRRVIIRLLVQWKSLSN